MGICLYCYDFTIRKKNLSDDNEGTKMDNGQERTQESIPPILARRRIFYVGMTWMFWLSSIYSLLFISWLGFLALLFIGQVFYSYAVKHKLAVLPRPFIAWFCATRFYDIFIGRVIRNRKLLGPYLALGIMSLVLGLVFLLMVLTDPALDLNQMVVVHGTYAGYQKLRESNGCGDILLKFRTENGDLAQFLNYQSHWNQSELQKLEQQTKNEILTIWGEPNTTSMIPECRKFTSARQIQGKGYQTLYHKEYHEKGNSICLFISVFFMFSGGLCLMRLLCDDSPK